FYLFKKFPKLYIFPTATCLPVFIGFYCIFIVPSMIILPEGSNVKHELRETKHLNILNVFSYFVLFLTLFINILLSRQGIFIIQLCLLTFYENKIIRIFFITLLTNIINHVLVNTFKNFVIKIEFTK
ncbi:hypothetical protein L9F63_014410, partial [Diploptera punctata]